MAFLYTLSDVLLTLSFDADAAHVPTFYAPSHDSDYKHFLVLAILGFLFGGIHCVGWNFPFHTYAEQKLGYASGPTSQWPNGKTKRTELAEPAQWRT